LPCSRGAAVLGALPPLRAFLARLTFRWPSSRPCLPLATLKEPLDVPCRVDDPNHFNAVAEWIVEDEVAVGHKDA
jgi:hypothetical protein